MPVLESALEDLFRRLVRGVLGGRVLKLAPTEKGAPDRLVLLPGGRLRLVELKTETGRVSPRQKLWHERARDLGVEVAVLAGRGEIEEWVSRMKLELELI